MDRLPDMTGDSSRDDARRPICGKESSVYLPHRRRRSSPVDRGRATGNQMEPQPEGRRQDLRAYPPLHHRRKYRQCPARHTGGVLSSCRVSVVEMILFPLQILIAQLRQQHRRRQLRHAGEDGHESLCEIVCSYGRVSR